MAVINERTSHNLNAEVGSSGTLMMQKNVIEEKDISFRAECKELDDEDFFCFVLGYN